MLQGRKILFLNLLAFSKNGGIERFNKSFIKALNDLERVRFLTSHSISLHDSLVDDTYCSAERYEYYSGKRFSFVTKAIEKSKGFDTVILGHINLALVGWLIKRLYPSKKVYLIAHGIEVWSPLKGLKRKFLRSVDRILCVSEYTKQMLVSVNGMSEEKISIFPNCIDPFFRMPRFIARNGTLRARYNIGKDEFIVYTLTRMTEGDRHKGYDEIIQALSILVRRYPTIKYLLAGRCSASEKLRLANLTHQYNLSANVIFAGELEENELIEHYLMADLYVMPSKKEGFGITFIEAVACGLPVIAGNKDGSKDALLHGKLGTLIDPDDISSLARVIEEHIVSKTRMNIEALLNIRESMVRYYSYNRYTERLREVLATTI